MEYCEDICAAMVIVRWDYFGMKYTGAVVQCKLDSGSG
jgi:hypothetical protein